MNNDSLKTFKKCNNLRLNPTDDEVETIKREIDEDESGEIDFQEFLEIMNCRTLR